MEFKIIQEIAENGDNVLRPHMSEIATYDEDFHVSRFGRQLVERNTSTILPVLVGSETPFAVFINADDYDYCKAILDANSIKAFQGNLHKVDEELTRMLIWQSFWDLAKDGKASSKSFLS